MSARAKSHDLPKYCYPRGNRAWYRVKNADDKWINKATPYTVDQVELIERFMRALLKGIAQKRETGMTEALTVREYIVKWIQEREARGVITVSDEKGRLEKYAVPHIGHLALEDVRPKHVRELIRELEKLKDEDGEQRLAARTILHIYSTLHNVFETAMMEERILANPIKIERKYLPTKIDKDPEWRENATYTLNEVEQLILNPLIPPERRVMNALKSLAGLRHGETAALCWRHRDKTTEPLPKLIIAQAYSSAKKRVKRTKTEQTRAVPEHPALTLILDAWSELWATVYGRQPTQDDFVVPARTMKCVDAHDANEAFKRDLLALGLRLEAGKLRDRGGHDLRAWFKTKLVDDGADSLVVNRFTHAPPKDVQSGYVRLPWRVLCRELGKLEVSVPADAPLPLGTGSLQAMKTASARWSCVATPTGFEPGKSGHLDGADTAKIGDDRRVIDGDSVGSPRVQILVGVGTVTNPLRKPIHWVSTAADMIERALRLGDGSKVLEVVRELKEMGRGLPRDP